MSLNDSNIGVAAADAPVVTFLDQDDEHLGGWYYLSWMGETVKRGEKVMMELGI